MINPVKKLIFIAMLLFAFAAVPVLAATDFLLESTTIDIAEQGDFTLIVNIDPKGVKNYTAKLEMKYPTELLEVKSFVFAKGWMQLNQPGYDLIDNTDGLLIKSAGYPGGFSKLITLGTVSFSAKKAGKGIIRVGENSLALNADNQNVPKGILSETSITIKEPILAPLSEEEIISSKEEITPLEEVEPPASEIAPPLFDILVEPVVGQFQKRSSLSILIAAGVIVLAAAYIIYRKKKKKIV